MKPEQLIRINKFLGSTIEPKYFACYLRQLQDYAVRSALEKDDGDGAIIFDGYYWLNEFLEILDPKLSTVE